MYADSRRRKKATTEVIDGKKYFKNMIYSPENLCYNRSKYEYDFRKR